MIEQNFVRYLLGLKLHLPALLLDDISPGCVGHHHLTNENGRLLQGRSLAEPGLRRGEFALSQPFDRLWANHLAL